MKNAQKVNKVARGLLICAMAFILSGVTLSKVFASYYEIKVEHVFEDYTNGSTVDPEKYPGTYTPRDDLSDSLEEGSLGVTVKNPDGGTETNAFTNGNLTGWNVGKEEALDVMEELLEQAKNDPGKEAALKDKFLEIQEEYDKLETPEVMEEPSCGPIPYVPDEDPGTFDKPEPPMTHPYPDIEDVKNGIMTQEKYDELYKLYKDELDSPEYQQKFSDWSKEKKEHDSLKANYDYCKAKYDSWLKENPDGLDEWEEYNTNEAKWEAYRKQMSDISKKLLMELYGGEQFEATDKYLEDSYQNAYRNVFDTIIANIFVKDDEGEITVNLDAAQETLQSIKENFRGLGGEIIPGDISVDTWATGTTSGSEKVDLFQFKAMLDEDSKTALKDNNYTPGETPARITVVCVEYEVDENGRFVKERVPKKVEKKDESGNIVYEIVKDDKGNIVYEQQRDKNGKLAWEIERDSDGNFVFDANNKPVYKMDENGNRRPLYDVDRGDSPNFVPTGRTATFVSTDNGTTWYLMDEDGTLSADPIDITTIGAGYVTRAVTYTFEHVWKPDNAPSNYIPSGETPNPQPPETIPENPPEEEIPDPEPPKDEPPEDPEIPDPDVPLADIPETGDISDLWYGAALVLAAGLAVLLYQERRSRKTA